MRKEKGAVNQDVGFLQQHPPAVFGRGPPQELLQGVAGEGHHVLAQRVDPPGQRGAGVRLGKGLPARQGEALEHRILLKGGDQAVDLAVVAATRVMGGGVVAAGAAMGAALGEDDKADAGAVDDRLPDHAGQADDGRNGRLFACHAFSSFGTSAAKQQAGGSPAGLLLVSDGVKWFRGSPAGNAKTGREHGETASDLLHRALAGAEGVLDAVPHLSVLGIVEAVKSADQVAGNPADPFKIRVAVPFVAAAFRAGVLNDAGIPAHRVAVDGVVDRAVTHAGLLHRADDRLKGFKVGGGIAVQLHIGDVAAVGQLVIGRLNRDLVERADVVIHRHVEGVGVVFPVGHAGDNPVFCLVHPDKAAGEALRRGGDQGEVQAVLLARFVHALAHVAHDLQAEVLGLAAFAVVRTDQSLEAFCQADEAQGQGAVLEHLPHFVVRAELVRVNPDPLPHQEGVVAHLFLALDFKAFEQLADDEVDLAVEILKEPFDAPVAADRDPGEVDRGEGEVAAAEHHLAVRVIGIGHYAGTAAHIRHLGVRLPLTVVFEVEGGVNKGEVGEQPLGADPAGQLEQVVVRLPFVVVDAVLDLEDVDGEDGGFAVAQPRFGGQQHVFDHHPPLRRGVQSVVDRAEGDLRAGAGMHGVEVMYKRLHGLVGGAVGFGHGTLADEFLNLARKRRVAQPFGQHAGFRLAVAVAVRQVRLRPALAGGGVHDRLGVGLAVCRIGQQLQRAGQVLPVDAAVGFGHPLGHRVVKVRHALPAVLVVLVGLDGDAGQRRIAGDVVRLPQEAMAGGKAAFKQPVQVDLAAGGGQGEEIQVVDVDIPVAVGLGVFGVEHKHFVELLGAL